MGIKQRVLTNTLSGVILMLSNVLLRLKGLEDVKETGIIFVVVADRE